MSNIFSLDISPSQSGIVGITAAETTPFPRWGGVTGAASAPPPSANGSILGDADGNGVVEFSDIASFQEQLENGFFSAEADVNEDGTVDFNDINPFIALLPVPERTMENASLFALAFGRGGGINRDSSVF